MVLLCVLKIVPPPVGGARKAAGQRNSAVRVAAHGAKESRRARPLWRLRVRRESAIMFFRKYVKLRLARVGRVF